MVTRLGVLGAKQRRALVDKALAYSKSIGAEHRRAVRQIWALFKPWINSYVIGVLILMVAESSWGVWYAKIMALPNMALDIPTPTIAKAGRQSMVSEAARGWPSLSTAFPCVSPPLLAVRLG
eukprot:SAG22_NODE_1257_length_4983_cov_2.902968_5_plen_122_part_00